MPLAMFTTAKTRRGTYVRWMDDNSLAAVLVPTRDPEEAMRIGVPAIQGWLKGRS